MSILTEAKEVLDRPTSPDEFRRLLKLAIERIKYLEGLAVDQYGNPLDGSSLPNCCFPDCGCDGARLCMADSGANSASRAINLERGKVSDDSRYKQSVPWDLQTR